MLLCLLASQYPVLTKCDHVFCERCLEEWFRHKKSCPKCNQVLPSSDHVKSLKAGAPLAHRILLRVRVTCPLRAQGVSCVWAGDYSEVHSHLTSSSEHTGEQDGSLSPQEPPQPAWVAEAKGSSSSSSSSSATTATVSALKSEADGKFSLKQYVDAASLYSKAIAVGGTGPGGNPAAAAVVAASFNNRAACLFMLRDYRKCAEDCKAALRIDPAYTKVRLCHRLPNDSTSTWHRHLLRRTPA